MPDPSVSRWHAIVSPTDHGFVIEDAASANGVFVNGSDQQRAILRKGDKIRLRHVELRFEP